MAVYDSVDPLRRELVLEPVECDFLRKLFLEDKSVFDEDTVLRFSQDVACAMQFVHQRGYIHCFWDHLVWYSTKVRFLDCSLSAVKP